MKDYWTIAICDECGEGYTSEEEYNNRHSPVVGDEHIEVHAECCKESEMSDYKDNVDKLGSKSKTVATILKKQRDDLVDERNELLEALKEIAKREGPYKIDQLEHAGAVIENMGTIADEAIEKAKDPK